MPRASVATDAAVKPGCRHRPRSVSHSSCRIPLSMTARRPDAPIGWKIYFTGPVTGGPGTNWMMVWNRTGVVALKDMYPSGA